MVFGETFGSLISFFFRSTLLWSIILSKPNSLFSTMAWIGEIPFGDTLFMSAPWAMSWLTDFGFLFKIEYSSIVWPWMLAISGSAPSYRSSSKHFANSRW